MSLKITLFAAGHLLAASLAAGLCAQAPTATRPTAAKTEAPYAPAYTQDGRLLYPEHYREWVFLSSGIDMSYIPRATASEHSVFDNVFVNPEAYAKFVQTGAWPDKTVLVLESRTGMEKGSINTRGHFQGTQLMGFEVHVKDEARFPGKWAFFDFDGPTSGSLIPKEAGCYSCHAEHAAVDTTFVQFYPTLLPVAKEKRTLSANYLKEEAAAK
ncbi:MAG: cytochrome P460 family protein [Terracidiphilus sp.]